MADRKPSLATEIPTPSVPELDSTPISAKPSESVSFARRGSLLGEEPSKEQLEEINKQRQAKSGDPAVMVEIPNTPSAEAYEVAEQKITGNVQDHGTVPAETPRAPTETPPTAA